jgi:hypothetical protein
MYDMTGVAGEFVIAAFLLLWGCIVRPGFYKLLKCDGVFEGYFYVCVFE